MNEVNNKISTQNVLPSKSRHSKRTFASMASIQVPFSIMGAAQVGFLLFYYQTVIKLDIWWIFLAVTLFTIF